MEISFNGINNLSINSKKINKFGAYLTHDRHIKRANKEYTIVKVYADLTDDKYGNDLSEFKNTLKKSRPYYSVHCVNRKAPENIEMTLIREDIKDDMGDVSLSNFKINNCGVILDEREVIPLLTYIAKFTKKVKNMAGLSKANREAAELINRSISEEAVKLLELI